MELGLHLNQLMVDVSVPVGEGIDATYWIITQRTLADPEYEAIHEIGFYGFTVHDDVNVAAQPNRP